VYKVFENLKKADSIIRKNRLYKDQISHIEMIKNYGVPTGYIGKLVEYYIIEKVDIEKIKWAIVKLKKFSLDKQIDNYRKFDQLEKELIYRNNLNVLHKLKRMGNIVFNYNKENVCKQIAKELDFDELSEQTFFDVRSDNDLVRSLNMMNGEIKMHNDWDIYLDNDDYLIYEVLSYEGAIALCHPRQCIKNKPMYDNYKSRNCRFFNIIDKGDIQESIIVDYFPVAKNETSYLQVIKWNDDHICKIDNYDIKGGKITSNIVYHNTPYQELGGLRTPNKDRIGKYMDKIQLFAKTVIIK